MPDQPTDESTSDARRRARPQWVLPIVLGLLGAIVGIAGYVWVADPNGSGEQATPTATSRPTPTTRPDAVSVAVYEKIRPSLVFIETRTTGDDGTLGSGVIVNEEGQILTAHHVVRDATTIKVTFADGTESRGRDRERGSRARHRGARARRRTRGHRARRTRRRHPRR